MKKAIAVILATICLSFPATAKPVKVPKGFYPALTQVVEIKHIKKRTNLIIAVDANGEEWRWYDNKETWLIGDFAAMIMYNNKTRSIKDDIIVGRPRYVGFKNLFF